MNRGFAFATALAALNQTLAESLKAINARLDQASDTSRKAFADQKILIDNIEDGVRVIRERSNDTNVRIGELREEHAQSIVVVLLQAELIGQGEQLDALGNDAAEGVQDVFTSNSHSR